VSTKKQPPKYNDVWCSKYLANIIEIFTTQLYIEGKNTWKFNVKIVFYYVFSITLPEY